MPAKPAFDKEAGAVHRDLRRAIKAMAMKYRIPTQLVRQPTIEGRDPTHPAKIAWNFFTGLYHKAGRVSLGSPLDDPRRSILIPSLGGQQ